MSIQIDHLTFNYPKSKTDPIINIEHWSVEEEQKYFLFGPSGSGKSTLLNLICGIYKPTSGTISVLDEDLTKLSTRQRDKFRANNIGYIFQQFNLVEYLSAIDNIKLATQFSSKTKNTDLEKKIKTLLETLNVRETDWHKPVHQLSVGQQQRVSIARAFINEPKLLIADEPTSALDADARDKFMSLLNSLCQENKSTLLFVSHDTYLKQHFEKTQALSDINKAAVK